MIKKISTKKVLLVSLLVVALLALYLLFLLATDTDSKPSDYNITVGTTPFLGEAATYIAYTKGFFKDEGINIQLKKNSAGFMSFNDVIAGKLDIAHVAELPLVYASLKSGNTIEKDFYIIADLTYSNKIQRVLARKDRGINNARDLEGKVIALKKGTTSDFYFDAFIKESHIDESKITIVDMNVDQHSQALINGDVDAVVTWQPHVAKAQQGLGDNALILKSDLIYSTAWLVVVRKEYAHNNPELLVKYLQAIDRSNNFILDNPQESIKIHSQMCDVDEDLFQLLWSDIDYQISLSEGLLTMMDDEARWVIENQIVDTKEEIIPNYLNYLYFDAIKKVNPEGITIIK